MPKAWKNPRRQRLAFQAVMILILGGTVGLAAAITHSRQRALQVQLGQSKTINQVSFRLPADWNVLNTRGGRNFSFIAGANEPGGEHRRIVIYIQPVSGAMTPEQYLNSRSFPNNESAYFVPIPMAGRTGTLAVSEVTDLKGVTIKHLIAFTFLSPTQVMAVYLTGTGDVSMSDIALLGRVVDSLKIDRPAGDIIPELEIP